MTHSHEVLNGLKGPYRELQVSIPAVISGYGEIHRAAMADGVLTAKSKELIALAIAITRQYDGCIAAHSRVRFVDVQPPQKSPR